MNTKRFFGAGKDAKAAKDDEQRRVNAALVQDAFIEEGEELTDVDDIRPVAPSAPALPTGFDMQAFAQILATAIAQGQAVSADVIKSAVADAAKLAREPIPEIPFAHYHRKSVFNPDGDLESPRPGLKCEMFLGQYDDHGVVTAAFEIVGNSCRKDEQELLNQLSAGAYPVKRHDGVSGSVVVQERKDANGVVNRVVIAMPHGWLGKDQQASMPSQKNLCEQILGGVA